jgi:hypothetical protein
MLARGAGGSVEQALVGERVSVVDRSRNPVEVAAAAGVAEDLAVAAVERDGGGPVSPRLTDRAVR